MTRNKFEQKLQNPIFESWIEKSQNAALRGLRRVAELPEIFSEYEMSSEEIDDILMSHLQDLRDIFLKDYSNAVLLDKSDIILSARGRGIDFGTAPMFVFSYMLDSSRRQINNIVKTLNGSENKVIPQEFEPEVIGFAPGSIHLGLAAPTFENTERIFGKSDPIIEDVKTALDSLAYASSVVVSESSIDDLAEHVPDPAARDATLQAISKIAPSSRNIIEEIGIIGLTQESPSSSVLTKKERQLARDISNKPREKVTYQSGFIGSIREIDLDQRRFEIRKVESFGDNLSIRCVYDKMFNDIVKRLLGRRVKVSGVVENDKDGMPRIIYVNSIEENKNQLPLDLT